MYIFTYNFSTLAVVIVDLTDKSLAPGAKRYQQALLSLKERVQLRSDFLLTDCHSGLC